MANIGQTTFTASGHGRRRGRGEKIHGLKLTSSSGKDDHVRHVAGSTKDVRQVASEGDDESAAGPAPKRARCVP